MTDPRTAGEQPENSSQAFGERINKRHITGPGTDQWNYRTAPLED